MYLSVKATSTEQRGVKHVYTIGCRQYDDTTIGSETIHLGKQRIQRIFPLVIASHRGILATGASYGINLIDKDDTRRLLFCLTEKVTHATGTDTDKHLHKV